MRTLTLGASAQPHTHLPNALFPHSRLAKEGADGDQAREDQLLRARRENREATMQKEMKEAQEAREILELKSLGIRTAMRAYKDLMDTDQDGGRAHSHDGVSKRSAQGAFFM